MEAKRQDLLQLLLRTPERVAPLVPGIVKEQIDEETGILVSKFVNQFDKPLVAVM